MDFGVKQGVICTRTADFRLTVADHWPLAVGSSVSGLSVAVEPHHSTIPVFHYSPVILLLLPILRYRTIGRNCVG